METTKITYEAPKFYCTEFETEDILTVSSTENDNFCEWNWD